MTSWAGSAAVEVFWEGSAAVVLAAASADGPSPPSEPQAVAVMMTTPTTALARR